MTTFVIVSLFVVAALVLLGAAYTIGMLLSGIGRRLARPDGCESRQIEQQLAEADRLLAESQALQRMPR